MPDHGARWPPWGLRGYHTYTINWWLLGSWYLSMRVSLCTLQPQQEHKHEAPTVTEMRLSGFLLVSLLLEGLFIFVKVSVCKCVFVQCRCVCAGLTGRAVAVCKWDKASGQKRKCQVFFFPSAQKQRSGTESRPVLLFLAVFSLACYCCLLWATGSPAVLLNK